MKRYIGFVLAFLIFLLVSWSIFKGVRTIEEKESELEYTIITVNEYERPQFNKDELNEIIDKYIDENACMTFEYNVFKIGDDRVSMYINCNEPKSIIYNYKTKEMLTIKDLINDANAFESSVKKLLNLKYPTFVTSEVGIYSGVYKILENEIIGYYKTENYGDISIKINNNEIKDLMNYELLYDEEYTNEEYTLDKEKKTIAFSFDDGPSTYDLDIIDYLTESHSSATFFLVGNRINSYKTSVQKMVDTGMEVGNHSYNHAYLGTMSKSQVLDQVTKTNNIYKNLTGSDMTLFRPPYGVVKSSYLVDANFPSIIWSLDTLDWQSRNAEKVYDKLMGAKDGDIILMHSLYKSTADAVKNAIPELYKKGFQIVSVSRLAELKGKTLEPGKGYSSLR